MTIDRKGKSWYKSAAREKGPSSFTFAEFLNVSLLRDFFGEKKNQIYIIFSHWTFTLNQKPSHRAFLLQSEKKEKGKKETISEFSTLFPALVSSERKRDCL